MRKVPKETPNATPTATASRRPQAFNAWPETAWAFIETAMSAGSATVVAKPIAAAKA